MNSRFSIVRCATPVFAAALLACGRNDGGQADDSAKAAAESSAMKDMPGMPGMSGMMMSDSMMAQMHSHMQMMDTASAGTMKAMLSMHRQMVANMLSRMTGDMRSMNMTGDAAWNATVDSLRQDLVHTPDMAGDELRRFMPAHRARMMRLMEMHRRMMGR